MDILKTLKQKGNDLYIEELEYFISELSIGDYSKVYIDECLEIINEIKFWKNTKNVKKEKEKKESIKLNDFILNPSDLVKGYKNSKSENVTIENKVKKEIENIRNDENYNSKFTDYVMNNSLFDENIINKLFNFLLDWEKDELLTLKSFSEDFLERYFDALDHSKIARYQYFSEEFFMKHFNDLSYSIVLQKGVNEWCKKANRSSKLDVFLRLKGVNI